MTPKYIELEATVCENSDLLFGDKPEPEPEAEQEEQEEDA